jgi:hypothetical protein
VEALRRGLQEICPHIAAPPIVVVENDGNAEAYGNFCLHAQGGSQAACWRLIIKLGTSLAGGAITQHGAVAGHIAEFAKPVFDFRQAWRGRGGGAGAVREFVSSKAVRNLTRTFRFEGKDVFGNLGGLNSSDDHPSRLEAVEVGELLDFCAEQPHSEDKWLSGELKDVLAELVTHDNARGGEALEAWKRDLAERLRNGQADVRERLHEYILRRGEERLDVLKAKRGHAEGDATAAGRLPSAGELGVKRVCRILGLPGAVPRTEEELLARLDADRCADAVAGSLAVFSQLGLHVAHLVVMLYNIYKSDRLGEIILAGGVTQGMSGRVIRHQSQAFLAKYYDKVFGPTKNLKPGFLKVAQVKDLNVVGPYGAAMLANRAHKLAAWVELNKRVEFEVDQREPGRRIDVDSVLDCFGPTRMTPDDARQSLERLLSESRLLRAPDTPDQFIKPVGG